MSTVKLANSQNKLPKSLSDEAEDTERRERLVRIARQYSAELDRVQEICLMLLSRKPNEVVFLLDWDVLRGFVEISEGPPPFSGEVSFLLGQARTDYAIPLGAFRELVKHLDSWSTVGHKVRAAQLGKCSSSAADARRTVAKALGVEKSDIDELSSEELRQEIESRLDSALIRSKRLTQILSSKRFRGIVSEYPAESQKAWRRVVEEVPRSGSGRGRSQRDMNDSINLAITTAATKTLYLLVTQTVGLLEVFGCPSELYSKAKLAVLEELAFEPDSGTQNYPVLNARVAAWLDLLDAFKMTGPAMTRTNIGRNSFENLRQELITMIAEERFFPTELFAAVQALDKPDPIYKHLKDLGKVFGIREETRLLEHTKINHLLEQGAISLDHQSKSDSVHGFKRPDLLLRSVDSVYCALEKKSADIGYAVFEDKTVFDRVQSVKLYRKPFIKGDAQHLSPSIAIEFYQVEHPYYAIRWATGAGDGDFANGVSNLLQVSTDTETRDSDVLDELTVLRESSSDHEFWNTGCIVETSCGAVGFPLEKIAAKDWNRLSIKWLAPRAQAKLEQEYGSGIPKPRIRAIRLNTEVVDLIYQCAPDNGTSQRMCGLISAIPMARRITSLFAITSSEHCLTTQLEASLHEAFSKYHPS